MTPTLGFKGRGQKLGRKTLESKPPRPHCSSGLRPYFDHGLTHVVFDTLTVFVPPAGIPHTPTACGVPIRLSGLLRGRMGRSAPSSSPPWDIRFVILCLAASITSSPLSNMCSLYSVSQWPPSNGLERAFRTCASFERPSWLNFTERRNKTRIKTKTNKTSFESQRMKIEMKLWSSLARLSLPPALKVTNRATVNLKRYLFIFD